MQNANSSITAHQSLPLMREVGRRKATRRERGRKSYRFVGTTVEISTFSLPQSASLTAPSSEGAFSSVSLHRTLYDHVDIFTNATEITVNIQITNSDYIQFHAVQICCSHRIFSGLLRLVMTTAIQFNNQPCLCTVKIHNIVTDCFLTLKSNRILSQIFIPQFSFPWCHIFTKCSCQRDVFFVILLHTAKKLLMVDITPSSTLASIKNSPLAS